MQDFFRRTRLFAVALCAIGIVPVSSGGGTQPAARPATPDPGWPRQYSDGTAKLVLYQPQVDSWKDFKKITARFAAELTPAKGAQTVWGVLSVESDTLLNLDSRVVAFTNFHATSVSFPSARDEAEAKQWEAAVLKLLPPYPTALAIERVLAYLDSSQVKTRQTAVLLDPPPILVTTQPAALVMIDGDPVLVDIEGTDLQKVMNTNWDLFFDKNTNLFYLLDGKTWVSAKGLTEAWIGTDKLPTGFAALPATDLYREIRQAAAKPQKPASVKLFLVVQKPSELIVLAGDPQLQPVEGTKLMWVTNTEADLFLDSATRQYYFLTSGRWFRAAELRSNAWTPATGSLPEDFRKIPPDHPRAHVLASVPGTRQADEAVLAGSIPRTATVERKSIQADVKYIGEPKFEPVKGTGVLYASNTPNDVFLSGGRYYLCLDGVWLVSSTAKGPWEAADRVPDEIYTIPPSSSKYNVTYVSVYESTNDTVTYGYTSGYTGMYVGYGVVMWGTGYYYPPYHATGYYPYPVYWPCGYYTYGASAWYSPATGSYGRGSAVYGPYGGYGRGAAFNPATGSYAWGQAAWGPYGAAASGGFYNPRTGTWGGGYRASNGYQSWGQSVVRHGDQWARAGSYSDGRGTAAAIATSSGGKAVAARGSEGQGFVGRSSAGDFYAGKDGNVYKRDQSSGQWYRNSGGAWEPMTRPAPAADRQPSPALAGANRDAIQSSLNRDASARSWGNYNVQRAQSEQNTGGWSGAGWTGYRSSGWSVRSPGFGGKR